MQRRQLVDDRRFGRFELGTFDVGGQEVERTATDDLADDRPGLARRAEALVEGQLVERCSLREVDEREHLIDRQHAFADRAMQVGDEAAARVHARVADGERQQPRQQVAETAAVIRVQRFQSGMRKDGDSVGGDEVGAIEQRRRDLLPQVVLQSSACLIGKHSVVDAHDSKQTCSCQ